MSKKINLTLKVWRQKNCKTPGAFETYQAREIDTAMSFLEMLDFVNEMLTHEGRDPITFDHDCREGICGSCGAVVNGQPHGPLRGTTLCQLHMRHFKDGQTLVVEPWRAKAFPINKDLSVERSSFDRVMVAGGFISVKTGQAPEAHAIPVPKEAADNAMDAAQCIGCGACVAACPNGSAMLFVGSKVSHLNLLAQGAPEKKTRVLHMVHQMDHEGFGNCSNSYECEAACPKQISVSHIAFMNKEYRQASIP
ncbi:MAG: succinate dehydrogenase/fumarate reductase iron-sulfur subunit [Candidatus Omnitrophica bacterium]|nr:succinate dehydrogenase/fumarate reductase iron-sulfur subunit [Candidatus Omnitrophota bacterium]